MEGDYVLVSEENRENAMYRKIKEKKRELQNSKEIVHLSTVVESIFNKEFFYIKNTNDNRNSLSISARDNLLNIIRKDFYLINSENPLSFNDMIENRYSDISTCHYNPFNLFKLLSFFREKIHMGGDVDYYLYNPSTGNPKENKPRNNEHSLPLRIKTSCTNNIEGLEMLLQRISDRLNMYSYKKAYLSFMDAMKRRNIKTEFQSVFTLPALYSSKESNTSNEMLVDYGMRLLYEKGESFEELLIDANSENKDPMSLLDSERKKYNDIAPSELMAVLSILSHSEKVKKEIEVCYRAIETARLLGSYLPNIVQPENDGILNYLDQKIPTLLEHYTKKKEALTKNHRSLSDDYENRPRNTEESKRWEMWCKSRLGWIEKMECENFCKFLKKKMPIAEGMKSLSEEQRNYIADKVKVKEDFKISNRYLLKEEEIKKRRKNALPRESSSRSSTMHPAVLYIAMISFLILSSLGLCASHDILNNN